MEDNCKHPVKLHGLCAHCGGDVSNLDQEEEDQANILHSTPGLFISAKEAARIEGESQRRLLSSRKLSLVVDLDQTVLHATIDPVISRLGLKDVYQICLPEAPEQIYNIKLRPGLLDFLESISKLYELHVYTMGSRSYAHAVVSLFDPEGRYFYDRVLSRDDVFYKSYGHESQQQRKHLKRIFPADDSMVVIIDDRADVWDYGPNLIPVPPYSFFLGVGDINRSGKTKTNFLVDIPKDGDGATGIETKTNAIITDDQDNEFLLIMNILEEIHKSFYSPLEAGLPPRDVKEIIAERRSQVFGECSIAFSGIVPMGMRPENFELQRLAEMFGSLCSESVSQSTHLVTIRNDTDKVYQALEAGIHIVSPSWLLDSLRLWKRMDESPYAPQNLPTTMPKRVDVVVDAEDLKAIEEDLENLSDSEGDGQFSDGPSKRPRVSDESKISLEDLSNVEFFSDDDFSDLERDLLS